jgi:8-oxo-dGTP pyrophosphatase MutT (NUDIX family)
MADEFKSLLLEEYKARSDAMAKSEQAGETRVNLFIGLITFVGGAIGALIPKDNFVSFFLDDRRFFVACALLALLVVGAFTLMRMITRNKHTDLCKRQLDYLRQIYRDQFDTDGSWVHYDLFPKGETGDRVRRRDYGGLAYVVAGLNSLIATAAAAVLVLPDAGQCPALFIVGLLIFFGIVIWVQAHYVQAREKQALQESSVRFPEDTHAGGIVFREANGVVEYLLVRAKNAPEWVLPKGHIEVGESHAQAALREVSEEAGVVVGIAGLVGHISFAGSEGMVRAKFYLMSKKGDIAPVEGRGPAWFSHSEALARLQHRESQSLLRKAEQLRLARSE